jgi:hypothetical protein
MKKIEFDVSEIFLDSVFTGLPSEKRKAQKHKVVHFLQKKTRFMF